MLSSAPKDRGVFLFHQNSLRTQSSAPKERGSFGSSPFSKTTFSFFFPVRPSSKDPGPPGLVEDPDDDEDDGYADEIAGSRVSAEVLIDMPDKAFVQPANKVAGNIARHEFRDFWLNELKADVWTVNILEHGYKLPFTQEPGQYQERNNKSARTEKPYLIESVASLKERGVVKKLRCRPWCTNPLTVSSRLVDGKIKKRLCICLLYTSPSPRD